MWDRSRRAFVSRAFKRAALAFVLTSCGGGLPLLHPARVLGPGEVRAAAGFSANVASAGFAGPLRAATGQNPAGSIDEAFAKGALVAASVAPGVAPWASARVGVGQSAEGGLTYTGRAVRADVRRSFPLSGSWSLSLGAGGSAVLYGRQDGEALAHIDLAQVHGWGADAPLLVGYSSDGDLYMFWLGARGGWEHVDTSAAPQFTLSATRWWAGGLLGLAVGFRHVHVAMEVDVSYASVTGDTGSTHAQVAGLMLTPSSCVWWAF
jgi:hypothetical protein